MPDATDPVCELAPLHHLVEDAVREDAVTGTAPEVREAPFHVLQEKMGSFGVTGQIRGDERFYEKVIKVKADVAALRNLFSDVSIDVRW